MRQMTIVINGKTDGDLELALEEVTRSLSAGNTSGFNRNDSGNYRFDITGDEEGVDD